MDNKAGTFLAQIKSTTVDTKALTGSFEAVLSVPSLDRDGEIVDARAFEPLPEHITIDLEHEMSVEKTIGSGRPYYDGEVLKFSGTYASHPLAQMVRSLVEEGHIRSMSVAYYKPVYEVDQKDGLPHLRKAELLNAGIVAIPANRQALITASKAFQAEVEEVVTEAADVKSGARHSASDLSKIQAAYEALGELGATCTVCAAKTADHTDDAEAKSIEISTETNPETAAAEAADQKSAAEAAVESPAAVDVAMAVGSALSEAFTTALTL